MNKKYSIAVLGCGSRGAFSYALPMSQLKDKYKIVAICDIDKEKLKRFSKELNISKENCFLSEDEFFKEKRADALVLATMDKDHVRQTLKALEVGYDILLEKPISPDKEELLQLLEVNKKYKRKVLVCHVLRYAPGFVKLKQLLSEGTIGKLVHIESLERVMYWHHAHSFVRGNWRNDIQTSPMIMQKCCHDLDLIQDFVGSKCKTVYSVGALSFFNRNNQPKGASERCQDCIYKNSCIYSAEKLYVERWKKDNYSQDWPYNMLDLSVPITEESLRKGYEKSNYGQCVFACDNNVVDNQVVDMVFENGVKASLVMTAFTEEGGRRINFHGTLGEIVYDAAEDIISVYKFGQEKEQYRVSEIVKEATQDSFGHGGGDAGIINSFYKLLQGDSCAVTGLEESVESHLIAVCAEESRKTGKVINVH